MRWEIIRVHYDGDVQKWRAVLFDEQKKVIEEHTFAFLTQAEKFIQEQNESI